MPSSHLILCCPLLLLPPIPPSIRVFSNESALCMRWPKYWSFSFSIIPFKEIPGLISFRMDWLYWSFSFSIIPSKEIPGLISFRMDWLDLLAVQGTLKSLLQHHSSKVSILRRSAFFTRAGERSYPTSEVMGRSWEDPIPEGQRPRRATTHPRSGAAAESARLRQRRSSQEEPPPTQGQGRRRRGATPGPRSCGCTGAGGPRGATPHSRSGGAAVRRYPSSKVRRSGHTLLEQP